MRIPSKFRPLELQEIVEAKKVFLDNIKSYSDIYLSDGIGDGDTPFTIPSRRQISWLPFDVTLPGRFVIFVGDAYDKHLNSKEGVPGQMYTYADLLIHELTHVWQFEHGVNVIENSLVNRYRSGEGMYAYDKANYYAWNKYNVEQQASIVEDWYHDEMKGYPDSEHRGGDIRFFYVEVIIRNRVLDLGVLDRKVGDLTPYVPPLPYNINATRPDPPVRSTVAPVLTDPLKELMAPRYNEGDPRSLERVSRLEELFRGTGHPKQLLARLEARRHDDQGVRDFYHILHQATQTRLLTILKNRR